MTLCSKCQTQNAPNATFCVGCGQALSARGARREGGSGGGQNKGMAMAAMILGILSVPTLGCLFVGAIAAIVLGAIAYSRTNKEPETYGGRGMAIAGIVLGGLSFLMVPVIGIVSAIAIPSLLRARVSANESAAIGDTRSVISAQAAYSSSNGGYYDTLECLGAPSGCLPDYTGPVFLDASLAGTSFLPKSGYQRTLHLGESADVDGSGTARSPTSARTFAYVSEPVTQGKTGIRAFCGDDTGRVCSWSDGSPTELVDGHCPIECTTLR
jgi:type II secretory pathway pseudopilin PulG